MGKKSFIFVLLFFFSMSLHAEVAVCSADAIVDSETPNIKQNEIGNTKHQQTKNIKKTKSTSSSLGVFKLLIPNSLK